MDRPQLIAIAIAIGTGGGCSDRVPRAGTGVARAAPTEAAATGLVRTRIAARGVLTYDAELVGDELVAIELGERFELVARPRTGAVRLRVDLGAADHDVGDLAIAAGTAWVASADGTARAIDLGSGVVRTTWHLGHRGTAIAATRDGRYVATGTAAGALCLRRVADGALLQCVAAHEAPVSGLDFAADGATLVSSGWDGAIIVWSVPALAVRAQTRVEGSANHVALAPDGRAIAIATSAAPPVRTPAHAERERRGQRHYAPSQVAIWRPGRVPEPCSGHGAPVVGVAWAGPTRVLSASWDRTVRLWDSRTCAARAALGGFAGIVRRVSVEPGSAQAAVAAWPGALDSPSSVVLGLLYPAETPAD